MMQRESNEDEDDGDRKMGKGAKLECEIRRQPATDARPCPQHEEAVLALPDRVDPALVVFRRSKVASINVHCRLGCKALQMKSRARSLATRHRMWERQAQGSLQIIRHGSKWGKAGQSCRSISWQGSGSKRPEQEVTEVRRPPAMNFCAPSPRGNVSAVSQRILSMPLPVNGHITFAACMNSDLARVGPLFTNLSRPGICHSHNAYDMA
ncbi:hypothetical protein PHSY_006926 [Pseudozyma hubeiensis SY62]|uniref:Uncharacterized protein n=1 Tax=Pseudozyma hubeiensis (strain SY62) TaxID=1305764 RepID=R9PML7_PSEHS|nr:hypothetical protein PHSY_006926 [Pseudozyma hubeiensis SY62]GAC99325.1 hypothetical protein PHSY_006926 [Pseudozyma hubeiensis SY62]